MSQDFLYPVVSVPATNFTEALTTGQASAMNNLYGVPPILSRRFLIKVIEITTKENYAPQLQFFAAAAGVTTDPATDQFLGLWGFAQTDAVRIAGAGLYRYWTTLDEGIPYYDNDWLGAANLNPPTLHCLLQNTGATSKSAGSSGSTKVTCWLQAMMGW